MISDRIVSKYRSKIVRLLKDIGDEFTDAGYVVSDPKEIMDDEHSWQITVKSPKAQQNDFILVDITIASSEYRDHTPDGMSFLLTTGHSNGATIAGYAPFNMTNRVWVPCDSPSDIDERWIIFENGVEPMMIVDSVFIFYGAQQ